MIPGWDQGGGLLRGWLLERAASLPFTIRAVLDDVRSRFLSKGRAGRGYRAIARNGRVLLASPVPVEELIGREIRLRFQVWHRAILPGDRPEPFGLLLCVDTEPACASATRDPAIYRAHLGTLPVTANVLSLDVGGGLSLVFRQTSSASVS